MIVPVKHISVLCMKEDRDSLIAALQKCGLVMLEETEGASSGSMPADMLARLERLRSGLKPYTPKKPLFALPPEVDKAELETVSKSRLEKAAEMEKLLNEIDEKNTILESRREMLDTLSPWINLKIPLDRLEDFNFVTLIPGKISLSRLENLKNAVSQSGSEFDIISDDGKTAYIVLCLLKDSSSAGFAEYGFEPVSLPRLNGLAADNANNLKVKVGETEKEIEKLKADITALATESEDTLILYEQLKAEQARLAAPALETAQTVIITGWTANDKTDEVEKAISDAVSLYDVEIRDPLPEETPPTLVKSNKLISNFESVTNMFSVPNYRELDPNPVMAPWYWIIFGLMMGDAGYGLMMAVLGYAAKKIMKPKGTILQITNIIIYSSVTSILAGIVFGSYFGETWNPLLFSSMDEPVKMLIFTLIVGAAHIFTALGVKIYDNVKQGKILDAIFDQVSWILIISGVGLIFLPPLEMVGIIMAGIGGVIVLFTAGREKKSIFGKIAGGLVALYGISGYFSDILSYSRILALGLATGVVGMVMNMLAGMVQGPWWGYPISIVIYIVGHVFNLALGLLSAYVHAARLQYIEFYGKFYEGNGRLFNPFSINPKLINIKQNNGGN